MNVLVFTKGTRINPASRYRYYQFQPLLKNHGINLDIVTLFEDEYYHRRTSGSLSWKVRYATQRLLVRLAQIPKARSYDLVVVENQLFPYEQGFLERLLEIFNDNIVIEFDDAIYRTPLHKSKLAKIISRSRGAIVGNSYLADWASSFTDNVHIVPTVIDTQKYTSGNPPPDEPFKIAWIGLPINLNYLRLVADPLARLATETAVELRVISSEPIELPGVPTKFIPWSENDEVRDIADCHIGIMPLFDTEFERGKCGAKVLQYMAAQRPAIASPVGVNADIVKHGENGLLAQSATEWLESFRLMVNDSKKRTEMGIEARATVEVDYSLESWVPKLAQIYRSFSK